MGDRHGTKKGTKPLRGNVDMKEDQRMEETRRYFGRAMGELKPKLSPVLNAQSFFIVTLKTLVTSKCLLKTYSHVKLP